jgi:rRNA maturation protein Rpf1
VISEIVESCRAHNITDLILVHEHRGQPDGLIVSHLPNGPTAYFGLLNVVSVTICCISNADSDITIWITSSANIIRFCCAGDSA